MINVTSLHSQPVSGQPSGSFDNPRAVSSSLRDRITSAVANARQWLSKAFDTVVFTFKAYRVKGNEHALCHPYFNFLQTLRLGWCLAEGTAAKRELALEMATSILRLKGASAEEPLDDAQSVIKILTEQPVGNLEKALELVVGQGEIQDLPYSKLSQIIETVVHTPGYTHETEIGGTTLVKRMAQRGRLDAVDFLLEKGASVEGLKGIIDTPRYQYLGGPEVLTKVQTRLGMDTQSI